MKPQLNYSDPLSNSVGGEKKKKKKKKKKKRKKERKKERKDQKNCLVALTVLKIADR